MYGFLPLSLLQNIKRLVAACASSGASSGADQQPLSLMVHRIGDTLLLDEFNFHRHLFKQQQDDWQWLSAFCEQLVIY